MELATARRSPWQTKQDAEKLTLAGRSISNDYPYFKDLGGSTNLGLSASLFQQLGTEGVLGDRLVVGQRVIVA